MVCARNGCGSTRTSATVIAGHFLYQRHAVLWFRAGLVERSATTCHSLERPRRGWQLRKPKNDGDGSVGPYGASCDGEAGFSGESPAFMTPVAGTRE